MLPYEIRHQRRNGARNVECCYDLCHGCSSIGYFYMLAAMQDDASIAGEAAVQLSRYEIQPLPPTHEITSHAYRIGNSTFT
jgi:hypothetical protein